MFAIVKTGGKQYKVEEGSLLKIERIDAEAGKEIDFNEVLAFDDGNTLTLGQPFISNAKVTAEVIKEARGDKIIIFKKQRRQNYRRKNGHRQFFTLVRIKEIKTA